MPVLGAVKRKARPMVRNDIDWRAHSTYWEDQARKLFARCERLQFGEATGPMADTIGIDAPSLPREPPSAQEYSQDPIVL